MKQGSNESSKSKKPARSSGKSKPSKSTAVNSPRAEAGPSDIDDKADNSGNDKANDGEDRDSGEEPEGDGGNHTKDSESQSDDDDDELVDGEFSYVSYMSVLKLLTEGHPRCLVMRARRIELVTSSWVNVRSFSVCSTSLALPIV